MSALKKPSHERPQKILVAIYKLSGGTTRAFKYEDIVVKAFELFPDEFALRGYPQFPDSSDIHKPLYSVLKKEGYVRSANKMFGLTPRGVEHTRRLVDAAGERLEETRSGDRLPRDVQLEVDRMLASDALRFQVAGQPEKILDTDFYAFAGCTVRTPRNDFLGRLSATDDAVRLAKKLGQPTKEAATQLAATWTVLRDKFKTEIDRRKERT